MNRMDATHAAIGTNQRGAQGQVAKIDNLHPLAGCFGDNVGIGAPTSGHGIIGLVGAQFPPEGRRRRNMGDDRRLGRDGDVHNAGAVAQANQGILAPGVEISVTPNVAGGGGGAGKAVEGDTPQEIDAQTGVAAGHTVDTGCWRSGDCVPGSGQFRRCGFPDPSFFVLQHNKALG